MRCALLQMCSGVEPQANADAVAGALEGVDADFVLTPEMTPLLQRDSDALRASVRGEADTLAPYAALARAHGIHLLLGSAAVLKPDGRIANCSVLLGPTGEVLARYDKMHLFEARLPGGESYREADSYCAGKTPVTAHIGDMSIGLSICYDLRFPAIYRGYGRKGTDMISAPSAFTRATGRAHWLTLLRARAIETGAWVLVPAQGGHHADGRRTWGRTAAISPWGEVAGLLDHDRPGLLAVDVTRTAVEDARARIPAWRQ